MAEELLFWGAVGGRKGVCNEHTIRFSAGFARRNFTLDGPEILLLRGKEEGVAQCAYVCDVCTPQN